MQVETGGGKRPDGGTSDQERLEYARAWVRDALQEWEEEKAKINLPKPAEHVGNNPLQTPGFSRPDGRAQAADVAFGAMKAAEQAAKAREAQLEKQLEQARQRTSALSFLEPDQAEFQKQAQESLEKTLEEARRRREALLPDFQKTQYAMLPLEPDWEEKSQYRSTANGKDASYTTGYSYNPGYDYGFATSIPQETGFQDERYDYINKNPQAIKLVDNNDTITGSYFLGLDKNYLKQMTGEEVKTYNYLYARDGRERAEKYLEFITPELTEKQRRQEEQKAAREAREDPVGTSVASVVASPLKFLTYLSQLANFAGDGKIDQTAAYNRNSYKSAAVRREVSKIAEENWGVPGSFLYSMGMGMGDFLMATALTGGNQTLTLAILGTGAAADATIEAKDRGLEDWQAFTLGTIAGVAEVITEKVSLQTLLDKASLGKDAVGYLLKNTLAGGAEEVENSLINMTADLLVSQEKSKWVANIGRYREQGYSERDAFWMALRDQAVNLGGVFLGGMVGGAIMARANMLGNSVFHKYQSFKNGGLTPDWTGPGWGADFLQPEGWLFLPEESGVQLTQGLQPDGRFLLPEGQVWIPEQPAAELPRLTDPQSRTPSQSQAGDEAAQGLIQLLLNQGEITPEEAAGLMAQNGGAEILYPEQPAAELPQLTDPQEAEPALPEQSQTYSQSQAGEEAARGLIQLLLNQGEITPEEAAGLMAQNGGAEILYPEQPAAELPDWAAEGMEKFGIPELSGEQTLPEQGQTYSQSQAGEEAAQALIQLLLDQGEITPEEAAELTNQEERRIQIPDWDYGEPEGSSLFDRFSLPGIESFLPGEFRGGKDLFPQGNGLPEEFQRPQGLSDWDWSLRQGEAAEAKNDLERSAALYNVGRTKLNAAKRISEELGRKVVFDGTMSVDKTGAIDPETGTIRLNARVGGPENLFDNAVRLLEEQPAEFPLDSADAGGYNAGEERLLLEAAGVGRVEIIAVDDLTDNLLQTKPKNSPNPQKWLNKGGKISIDKDGVWVYTNSKGQSVKYVDGYPDFKGAGLTNQEVDIGQFKDYTTDFKNADLLAPNGPRDAVNNTWHHSQDGHTLQEVDKAVHKEFTHRGGMSLNNIKRGELK
ncbi:MAG: HNH endonuclease [Oscillospiraceae bacterium]|nr:HNH endonuclease [Oscillospiraceae bacterium]